MNAQYAHHAGGTTSNLIQVDFRIFRKLSEATEVYVMMSPILPTNLSGNSGILSRTGFTHRMKIGSVELEPSGWVLHDSGIFRGERGFSFRGEIAVPIRRGEVTISPIVRLSVPMNMGSRKVHAVVGLRFLM